MDKHCLLGLYWSYWYPIDLFCILTIENENIHNHKPIDSTQNNVGLRGFLLCWPVQAVEQAGNAP